MEIYFATSNENKYNEALAIFSQYNITVKWLRIKYLEIQSDNLREIAEWSAKYVYSLHSLPLFVEDTGLFIEALNGFPGPYSSYVMKTLGNEGILKLMNNVSNRKAYFLTIVAFVDKNTLELFEGKRYGTISKTKRGTKWGFDPIFIPDGYDKTYSELGPLKNEISHRRLAYEKFIKWLLNKEKES